MSGGWVNQLCALAALAGHAPTPAASLLACSGSMRPPPLPCRASRRSSACAGFRPRACCGAGVAGPSAAPRPLVLAPAPLAWRSSGAPRGQSAAVRMLQGYRGRWASAVGQQGGRCSGAACRRRRQRQRGNRRRRPPHPTCSTPPELGGQLVLHAGRHPVAQQRELRHLRSGWEGGVGKPWARPAVELHCWRCAAPGLACIPAVATCHQAVHLPLPTARPHLARVCAGGRRAVEQPEHGAGLIIRPLAPLHLLLILIVLIFLPIRSLRIRLRLLLFPHRARPVVVIGHAGTPRRRRRRLVAAAGA